MKYIHIPVMIDDVLKYLEPKEGNSFIDCTMGGAGYTLAVAKKIGEKGKIISIDADELAIKNAEEKIGMEKINNIILVKDNFCNLTKIVKDKIEDKNYLFDGIFFDLGLSSAQLDDKNRGFSFMNDTSLNMFFGEGGGNLKTENIINNYNQEDLEKIFKEYGEERFSKRIAQKIIESRKEKKIKTTGELVEIIKKAIPKKYLFSKIHPATRVFQALRIATNNELESLSNSLIQSVKLLKKGGKIVVVSYHSLEDRIVKKFFKKESINCICPPKFPICKCSHKASLKILTKKVALPSSKEIEKNSRARSAKMRVAEKI